jgi:DNA-binding CsgD family transcriptional regulator
MAKVVADTRFYRDGDLTGALAMHADARGRVKDPEIAAAIDARRAGLLAEAGRPADALELLDSMDDVGTPMTLVELAGARATCLIALGRFDEARSSAKKAASMQAALSDASSRRGIARHLMNEAHALAYAGHYAEARAMLLPAADRARSTAALHAWVWFEMALAEIARDTGRGHEAVRRFAEVADVAPTVGQDAALVWAHVGVAQGHLLLGRCEEAAAALARADEAGYSPVATSWGTRERARAWLDACRGDLSSARERVRETLATVEPDGVRAFEVALLHDLVRLGVPEEAVDGLAALAGVVDGPLVGAHLDNARALLDRDPVVLGAVVDRYEHIDALALAAEAAAELADLHRAREENRLATAARQRANDLAERAGGIQTPVLARGAGVEPLTAREREVALLAANGRSTREIADRLGVSTRTVETHLARVYRKLGVSGRAELTTSLDT